MIFEYGLQHPNGYYYTGEIGLRGLGHDWEAYKYSLEGAHRKVDTDPVFRDFTVVRLEFLERED